MTATDYARSATLSTTVGGRLPDAADWLARPITLPGDAGALRQAPAPLLRRVIHLEAAPASARLHVTALGLHDVRINGARVAHDLLAPGWTAYRHRVIVDMYDVTGLLLAGENVIAAAIGDGWYRGRLGFHPGRDRCTYGTEIALIAQLELTFGDGSRRVIATDRRAHELTELGVDGVITQDLSIRLRHPEPAPAQAATGDASRSSIGT